MNNGVLRRYALAYIKENGSDKNVQEFLRSRGMQNIYNWSDKNFENAYKEFRRYNPTNEHNIGSDRRDSRQQPTSPQVTHVHVHNNRGLDFWDYFLLRSLFSGNTGHTTVINNLGSGSSNQPSREDKKKDAEDNSFSSISFRDSSCSCVCCFPCFNVCLVQQQRKNG